MNSEELKIIGAERKEILNDILEELQTKSLKDLFSETRDKENRIEKLKDALEELYKDFHYYERRVKNNKRYKYKDYWLAKYLETQDIIDAIENDYSNHIQGGYGFISEYLGEDESGSEDESRSEDESESEDGSR